MMQKDSMESTKKEHFFNDLCEYMISYPIIVQVLMGKILYQDIENLWVLQTQQMLMITQLGSCMD